MGEKKNAEAFENKTSLASPQAEKKKKYLSYKKRSLVWH